MKEVVEDVPVIIAVISWTVLCFVTKQSRKVTILLGLVLLLMIPVFVIYKKDIVAQNSAIFAFTFIALGVFHQFISLLRDKNNLND